MIRPAGGAIAAALMIGAMSCTGTSSVPPRPDQIVPRFVKSGVVPITGLTSRQAPAVAWSGRELLVFGGYREREGDQRDWLRDGALATLDAETGRWSVAARIPESAAPRPSPSWANGRAVPGAYPAQVLGIGAGRTVVVLDRSGARSYWLQASPGGKLSALPDPASVADACVAGNRLVVAAVEPGSTVSLRILDLGKPMPAWENSTPAPGATSARVVACMGSRVMLTDRYSISGAGGLVYDLTSRSWTEAATPPTNHATTADGRLVDAPFYADPTERLWTGSELLELTDFRNPDGRTFPRSRAYDPVANSWRLFGSLPVSMDAPQWTGSAVVDFTTTRSGRPAVAHFVVRLRRTEPPSPPEPTRRIGTPVSVLRTNSGESAGRRPRRS